MPTLTISEAALQLIRKAVAEAQQQLLAGANSRTTKISSDFNDRIKKNLTNLHGEKTGLLVQLEKQLNAQQELILQTALKRMGDLTEQAQSKFDVLGKAQAQSSAGINKITEQVVTLGQEDASHGPASITTTTVITTKAAAASEAHVKSSAAVVEKIATQIEYHQNHLIVHHQLTSNLNVVYK